MATEAASKAGLSSIQFKEMDAEAINLPESDGKTDFIWIVEGMYGKFHRLNWHRCCAAMSHFPHKKQFLMHANRLLKKNGRIIIADWVRIVAQHLICNMSD